MCSVVTEEGKCDAEILRRTAIEKNAFQKQRIKQRIKRKENFIRKKVKCTEIICHI